MSAIYPRCRARFETGQIDLINHQINGVMTPTGFDGNHDTIGSIAVTGSAFALSGKGVNAANGLFVCNNVTTGNATGTVNAIVIYHAASGALIAYLNTMAGLPASLSNEALIITWAPGGLFLI